MATRRSVGRVRHLEARLLWLQQLCAEGVVEVRARPGERNEADQGTKMVDLRRMTSLLKGTPLQPLMDGGDDSPSGCSGNGHCDSDGVVRWTVCEYNFRRRWSAERDEQKRCMAMSKVKLSSTPIGRMVFKIRTA